MYLLWPKTCGRREGLGEEDWEVGEDKDWVERKTASGEETFSEQGTSGYKVMTYHVLRDRFGLRTYELAHTLELEHIEIREVVGECY